MGQTNKGYAERMRTRIEASKAGEKMLRFIEASPDESKEIMNDSQLKAAIVMLKKVLPDLSQQSLETKIVDNRTPREMTRDEMLERISAFEARKQGRPPSDMRH